MRVVTAGRLAIHRPFITLQRLTSKAAPHQMWKHYARLCRRSGLTSSRVVLSLDCDTAKDIRVVPAVDRRLQDLGISPVYAVPGQLLEHGSDVYGPLAEQGVAFLNHGYAEHTHLDETTGVYESTLFYDRIDRSAVRDDVEHGDDVLHQTLRVQPDGFRTPHFGSYQGPDELRHLHSILDGLGYRLSTSTMPMYAYRFGPAFRNFGIWEIPVTGCPDWPLGILDSFGFRFAPGRTVGPADYVRQASLLTTMLDDLAPLFINLYADPSQVYDWPEFFGAMERLTPYCATSYADVVRLTGS